MTIPKTQYGFVYTQANGLNLKEDIPVVEPGSDEVLLKIDAVGLCHSDLHVIYDGLAVGDNYVMGHEIAGTIVKTGSKVTLFKDNDRVAAVGPNPCGDCTTCRTGFENDCPHSAGKWFGLGVDGGYQQYLLVKRPRNLVKIPDNVDSADAAAITDAVLTPYHALKLAGVRPSSNVLFFGAGGLGVNAIQIAKAFGATVTVIDKKEKALDVAKSLGADAYYTKIPEDVEAGSFDVAIDLVGIQATFDECQKYVKPKGVIVPVGLGAARLSFDLGDLALREINILGSFWGTATDLKESFELASQGKVKPKVREAPLRELPEWIIKLKNGEYEGRVVFRP
ncbi:secondary alcohol dehydrogenase [Scheffersomyces xylosifermentans]|uniref:secondary alcohol dehydrogenase n=1 Tax=Scheffersomyces xylosifermentans TaxID=1304137 RepID=UPI00315C621F